MLTQIITSAMLVLASSTSPPEADAPDTNVETDRIGWGGCAGYAALAVVECSIVFPLTCVAGTVLAACQCMPLILSDFEEYSCPGLG